MNQESITKSRPWHSCRITVDHIADAAFLSALVFLAAWPWEIFQRVFGRLTLALGASMLILGFGLIRTVATSPRRIRLPEGLGLPIALIAFACLQSALHSADLAASKALITKYVWYLLLFGMAAPLFSRPGNAALAWRVFSVSAGLVGVCAVLCAAGWFTPALAGTHEYFGRRLTEDVRVGAFVRIAATTPDYNQAILPMLAALPLLLVWAASPASRRAGRIVAAVLVLFVVAGVVVSFSRSGLIAVAAVFAAGALLLVRAWFRGTGVPPVIGNHAQDGQGASVGHPFLSAKNAETLSYAASRQTRMSAPHWRLGLLAALLVVVLCVLVFLAAGGYTEMLVRRALRGFDSPDPSYRSRFYVFGLFFKLLPKYALFGCGIGASGAAIGAVAEPGKWMGTAIHSMPLMMWFETGVLGLVGYFWLWWRVVRRVWTGLMRSPETERRQLGYATLGALAVLFWMTAVQPFQELSLFPVLAALIVGSACGKNESEAAVPTASWTWHIAFPFAMVLVAGLVGVNIGLYNRVVARVSEYAVALERGLAEEQRGDWAAAKSDYESASMLAKNPAFPSVEDITHWAPYYGDAFRAADLEFIFMRLPGRGGPPGLPGEVADFGVVRCLWNAGSTDEARKVLYRSVLPLFWPEAEYASGEMHWQQGALKEALSEFARVAQQNRERGPWPPLEYPFDVAPSMDDIYRALDAEVQALSASAALPDVARRVAALLRLDRREEAVSGLKAAPADAPELAFFRDALDIH